MAESFAGAGKIADCLAPYPARNENFIPVTANKAFRVLSSVARFVSAPSRPFRDGNR